MGRLNRWRFTPLLLMATMLVGCGGQATVFTKPGVAERQQRADEAACTEASIGEVQDPRPSPLPPLDRDAFDKCMRAKGYVPARK